MPVNNVRVDMHFNARTQRAQSNIAKLEGQLAGLKAVNKSLGHDFSRLNAGLPGFGPAVHRLNVEGPLRSMDSLVQRIQQGKIGQEDFRQALGKTNNMIKYQIALREASLTSAKKLGSTGRGIAEMHINELGRENSHMLNNAARYQIMGNAAKAYGRRVMDVGKNLAFMGRQTLLSITAPLAVLGGATSMQFYKIDQQLTQLAKVYGDLDDTAQASTSSIRKAARGLAEELNEKYAMSESDTLELASAFAQLGESGKALDDMTSAAARLMRLGDVDSSSAMRLINVLRNTFKMTGEELGDTINLMNTFENTSTLAMQDFADGFPKMASVIESWGGNMREAGYILEAFTSKGIRAREGANSLKTIFAKVARPTKQVQDMWAEMTGGKDFATMARSMHNNVTDVVAEIGRIENALNISNEDRQKFAAQLAGAHQVSRFMALSSSLANPTDSIKKIQEMSDAEFKQYNRLSAEREIETQMQSASAQFDKMVNRISMTAEKIGSKILPTITSTINDIMNAGQKVYNFFKKIWDIMGPLQGAMKELAKIGAGLAMAFAPALLLASSINLMRGGLITFGGKLSDLLGKRMAKGENLFRTMSQKADELRMRRTKELMHDQTVATTNLTAAIQRLDTSYKSISGSSQSASSSIQRATDTQTSATRRQTSATRRNTRATRDNAAAHAAALRAQGLRVNYIGGQTGTRSSQLQQELSDQTKLNRLRNSGPFVGGVAASTRGLESRVRRLTTLPDLNSVKVRVRPDTHGFSNEINSIARRSANSSAVVWSSTFSKEAQQGLSKNMQSPRFGNSLAAAGMARFTTEEARARQLQNEWASKRQAAGIGLMDRSAMSATRQDYNARQRNSFFQQNLRSQKMTKKLTEQINTGILSRAHTEANMIVRNKERVAIEKQELAVLRQQQSVWAGRASKIGMAATAIGGIGLMANSSNRMLNSTLSILTGIGSFALIAPKTFGNAFTSIANKATKRLGSTAGKMKGIISGLGTVISKSILPLAGISAAIGAATMAVRLLRHETRRFKEQSESIKKTIDSYPEILGYTARHFGQIVKDNGQVIDTVASLAEKMKEDDHSSDLIDKMKSKSGDIDTLRQMLQNEALKMYYSGAKPDDVKMGIEALLNAANINPKITSELMVEFENVSATGVNGESLVEAVSSQITDTFGNLSGNLPSYWDQMLPKSMNPLTADFWKGTPKSEDGLSELARQRVSQVFSDFAYGIRNAEAGDEREKAINAYFSDFRSTIDKAIAGFNKDARQKIKDKGIFVVDPNDLGLDGDQKQILNYLKDSFYKFRESVIDEFGNDQMNSIFSGTVDNLKFLVAANLEQVVMSFDEASKAIQDTSKKNWDRLNVDQKKALISTLRLVSGQEQLNDSQMSAAISAKNLGDEMPKIAEGGKDAKDGMDEAADGIDEVGESADDAQKKLDDLRRALESGAKGDWSATVTINIDKPSQFYPNGDVGAVTQIPYEMSAEDMVNSRKQVMENVMKDYMDEMEAQANIQRQAEKRAFQEQQQAAKDALSERHDAEKEALKNAQDQEKKTFDANWDQRIEKEEEAYDSRINAIKDVQDAEDELERKRKRNSEREARRLKYQQSLMQTGINMNIALAGGDLDEAARISMNAATQASDYARETTDAEQGYKKEDEDRARKKKIDQIGQEKQDRLDSLKEQRRMEEEAMQQRLEIQKKELDAKHKAQTKFLEQKQQQQQIAYDIQVQANQRALNRELEALRTQIPLSEAELKQHMGRVQIAYDGHGIMLMNKGDYWAKVIEDSLINRTKEATAQMSNDAMWRDFGNRVALGVTQGAFNMDVNQFNNFLRTGDLPGLKGPAGGGGGPLGDMFMPFNSTFRHSGGPVIQDDKYNNRAGRSFNSPLSSDEQSVIAQKGEYMMSKDAHSNYGTDAMNAVNAGTAFVLRHDGGPVGLGAFGGAIQAALAGPVISRVALAAGQAAMAAKMMGGGGGSAGPATPLTGGGIEVNGAKLTTREQVSMWKAIQSSGINAVPTSATRTMDVGSGYDLHMQGKAIDFAPNNALASWIYQNYPNSAELIYGPGPLMYNKNGLKITDQNQLRNQVYAGDLPGHWDHVHWAVNSPVGKPGGGGVAPSKDIAGKFPQYSNWTTAGIQKYQQKAAQAWNPFGLSGGPASSWDISAGAEQWRGLAMKALMHTGFAPPRQYIEAMLRQIQIESSGNPNIIQQVQDVNSGGNEAVGLLQVIPGTFAANRDPSLPNNRRDPFANMVAALNYVRKRYGNPNAIWPTTAGYDSGGLANGKGIMQKDVLQPERVLSPRQTRAFENLIPMLGDLSNMGVKTFDANIGQIAKDAQLAVKSAESIVRNAYDNSVNQSSDNFNINIDVGNVTGVDDLELRLRALQEEIVDRIKQEKMKKERRLGGR